MILLHLLWVCVDLLNYVVEFLYIGFLVWFSLNLLFFPPIIACFLHVYLCFSCILLCTWIFYIYFVKKYTRINNLESCVHILSLFLDFEEEMTFVFIHVSESFLSMLWPVGMCSVAKLKISLTITIPELMANEIITLSNFTICSNTIYIVLVTFTI